MIAFFAAAVFFDGPAAAQSTLLSSVLGGDSLDSDATLLLRKLGKKAPETKLKALAELREAIPARGPDWAGSLLPHWTLTFARLADDGSWQVREQSCIALDLLAKEVRRQLAPHLKQLIAPWLRCRFDAQQDVRRAAMRAFESAFPAEGKYAQALAFCRDELVRALAELVKAPPPAKTGDADADADAVEAYTRRVSTSLQALAHLISEAVAAAGGGGVGTATQSSALAALGGQLTEQLLDAKFWRLGAAKATPVRCAVYTFSFTLLQRLPDLAMEMAEPLATALLDGLSDREPTAHAALWDPLLLLLRSHPTALQASTAGKHILPRLLSLLRNGCFGAATTVSSALLPFASLLPEDLVLPPSGGGPAPAAQLLGAIWEGLRSDSLPAAHFRALLTAHAELLQLLVAKASASPTARYELLAVGIGGPLALVLEGELPPRLKDTVAVDSLCAAVVALAASSRCTDAPDSYLPALVASCQRACLPRTSGGLGVQHALPRHQPPHCAAPPASARLHDGGVECRGVYGLALHGVARSRSTPHACGAAC